MSTLIPPCFKIVSTICHLADTRGPHRTCQIQCCAAAIGRLLVYNVVLCASNSLAIASRPSRPAILKGNSLQRSPSQSGCAFSSVVPDTSHSAVVSAPNERQSAPNERQKRGHPPLSFPAVFRVSINCATLMCAPCAPCRRFSRSSACSVAACARLSAASSIARAQALSVCQ